MLPVSVSKYIEGLLASASLPSDVNLTWDDEHRKDIETLLSRAEAEAKTVRVSFDRLTPELLLDIVLGYPCVEAHQVPRSESGALSIGELLAMPTDPSEYESSRGLSLVSDSMRDLIGDLRFAIATMRRPNTPLPPWDPDNNQTSAVRSRDGGYVLRNELPQDVNLADLFLVADNPKVRERMLTTAGAEQSARSSSGWDIKPPCLMITGASGTGKTLLAKLTHDALHRSTAGDRPFISLNCGGINPANINHVMFGSAPGQWTGISARVGDLARACYGTVMLDEVGDLQWDAQSALLLYLQDGLVRPTGIMPYFGFTQVIGATNRDLEALIRSRKFRHDFRARFGWHLHIPSLEERSTSELRQLIDFVAQQPVVNPLTGSGSRAVLSVDDDAMDALTAHRYRDGNFRELEQIVHAGIMRARRRRRSYVELSDLDLPVASSFRSEVDANVVLVRELPDGGATVIVENRSELVRLAEILEQPILRNRTGREMVSDGVTHYVTSDAEPRHD